MPGACYVMIKLHRYMWLWRRLIASRGSAIIYSGFDMNFLRSSYCSYMSGISYLSLSIAP